MRYAIYDLSGVLKTYVNRTKKKIEMESIGVDLAFEEYLKGLLTQPYVLTSGGVNINDQYQNESNVNVIPPDDEKHFETVMGDSYLLGFRSTLIKK